MLENEVHGSPCRRHAPPLPLRGGRDVAFHGFVLDCRATLASSDRYPLSILGLLAHQ